MNSKFYISYEAAALLKEKGYNEECDYIIDDDGDIFEDKYRINQDLSEWKWSCPTKAEAIDWLESKGIHIELRTMYCEYKQEYGWHWFYAICKGDCIEKISERNDCIKLFPTRLEAEEAAIIKSCELL